MVEKVKKTTLNARQANDPVNQQIVDQARNLSQNFTPYAPSQWFQSFGFDDLRSTTGQIADAAITSGWRETGIDSISRMNEIRRAEELTNYNDDDLKKLYNQRHNNSRGGKDGYKRRPTLEEFGLTERPTMLQPDEANTKFGIPGHLSWDKPVSSLVASIQHKRKLEEQRLASTMGRAQGFVDNSVGFGLAMGTAIFDPVGLAIGFVPIIGQAKYAKLGVTASRFMRGAEAGFVGSLGVEPFIYSAKIQEKADYDMMDSLTNIAFGTVAGGGLFAVGGKFYDGYKGLRQRSHAAALETSIKQLGNGKDVEISQIATVGASNKVYAVNPDAEAPAAGAVTLDPLKPGEQVYDPYLTASATKFDSDLQASNPIKHYKPYQDVETSLSLMEQATGPKAAKVTAAQVAKAMQDPDFAEAVTMATKNGLQNNVAFYVRTKDGQVMAVKANRDSPIGLLTSKAFAQKGTIDMSKVSSDLKDLLAVHGISVEEGSLDISYKGSYQLAKNNLTHVMEVKNAVFDPKQNQHDVVFGPEDSMKNLFVQDPTKEVFNDLNPKGKQAVESVLFDPDAYLQTYGDVYNSFAGYDTAFDVANLEQIGPQEGTNKGGLHLDKNDNSPYYVKYQEVNHSLNEWVAATLYRWYGVAMPKTTIVQDGDKVVGVASDYIKGMKTISPAEFKQLPKEQREAFAKNMIIDAYLANWDVVGNAPKYNMQLIEGKGVVWRIDPGGALLFRAQGAPKGAEFKPTVGEYKTLLQKNPDVFGEISLKDTEEAVARILRIPQEEVNKLVDTAVLHGMDPKLGASLKETLGFRRLDLEKTFDNVAKEVAKEQGTVKFFNYSDAKKFLDQFYNKLQTTLTPSEMSALKGYTNSDYVAINQYLWGKEVLGKPIDANMDKRVALLDSIFKKIPETTEKYEVWRGNVRYTTFNDLLKDLPGANQFVWDQTIDGDKAYNMLKALEGKFITMHGFTSTSFNVETAKKFHGSYKGKSPMTKILVPEGTKATMAGAVSTHPETELVINRGMKYRIKEVYKPSHEFGDPMVVIEVLPDNVRALPFEASDAQKLKMAKAYQAQPSNAADPTPMLGEPKDAVADTMKAIENDLKLVDSELESLQANLEAELANMDPELSTALKTTLENELKTLDQQQADAVTMHKAAQAAAVCIQKGM
jgi:hypothetical protein